jgi:hypothetical protein
MDTFSPAFKLLSLQASCNVVRMRERHRSLNSNSDPFHDAGELQANQNSSYQPED